MKIRRESNAVILRVPLRDVYSLFRLYELLRGHIVDHACFSKTERCASLRMALMPKKTHRRIIR